MKRRTLAMAAFAATAAGGAALGWAGERRMLRNEVPASDPEWEALRTHVPGRTQIVESFDGTHLHVDVVGDERHPTIVMAHGYALSHKVWHFQRKDLTDEFRIVSYDQRGHGASEEAVSGDYSIDAFGRDLSAVIEATLVRNDPVFVVGHSMGGMTLLSYVNQYPEFLVDRVAGAILMSTSGSDVITGGLVSATTAMMSGLSNRATRRVFQSLGRRTSAVDMLYSASNDLSYMMTKLIGLSPDAAPAHVAFTQQLLLDCPTAVKAAIGPMFTSLDLREAAPLLKTPALVIVGERDRLTPPAQAQRLAELLPDAELVELPEIGHMTPLEAHAEVNAHIRAFVRRVRRGT
jgi:pimeloyl-ACP methyl ester carboxylesterase